MSIRFSGDKQALQRTTNLPADFVGYTICMCVKLANARPTNSATLLYTQSADPGSTSEILSIEGTAGTSLYMTDDWGANRSPEIGTVPVGGAAGAGWWFVAIQGTASGANGARCYYTPISPGNTLSYQTVTNTPATAVMSILQIGDAPFNAGDFGVAGWWLDGSIAHLSIYDRQLNEVELLAQSRQGAPVSSTNLLSYHAFNQSTLAANLLPTQGTGDFVVISNSPAVSTDMPVFASASPTLSGSDSLPSAPPTTTPLNTTGNITSLTLVNGQIALVSVPAPPPPPGPVDPNPPAPAPAPAPAPPVPEPENPDLTYAPILLGFYTDAQGYITMKQANATLDYGFDWTNWLNGDTIASSTWAVESGLTKGTDSISADRRTTSVFLSGGTAGSTYRVTNTVTTSTGRADSRTFRCRVI